MGPATLVTDGPGTTVTDGPGTTVTDRLVTDGPGTLMTDGPATPAPGRTQTRLDGIHKTRFIIHTSVYVSDRSRQAVECSHYTKPQLRGVVRPVMQRRDSDSLNCGIIQLS